MATMTSPSASGSSMVNGLAVDVRDVRKVYTRDSQQIVVLDGITLAVPEGEFLALMGPSGSGKTTLLNLIAGIDRPTSGRVVVAGTDLGSLSESALAKWRSRTVGFIFQFYNLIPVLTAVENVELPLLYAGVGRRERRARALAALDAVGLTGRAKHLPHQMSGGEQQRTAIARSVVHRPALLLADEPTGNVDTATTEALLALMLRFRDETGLTIVVVTHNPWIGERAGRLVRLRDGRVVS